MGDSLSLMANGLPCVEGNGISGGAHSSVTTQRWLVGTSFSSHFFINVLDSCQEDDFVRC